MSLLFWNPSTVYSMADWVAALWDTEIERLVECPMTEFLAER